jgi:PQQ-dependent dehydrogenase (methanol/ethanol family)
MHTRLSLLVGAAFVCLVFAPPTLATPNGLAGATKTAIAIPLAPAFAPRDLAAPARAEWATNGGDYGQTRYSRLDQITTANVGALKAKWHIHLDGSATAPKYKGEGTPLVYKGIMYLVTGNSDVFAIDATTGDKLWTYHSRIPQLISTVCCGWASRGIALGDGKVFVAQLDGLLVALDQQTGAVDWATRNASWEQGYTMTMAPLYYNGLVIVGVSGAEFGARGSETAYAAEDGHRVWRFYTTPAPGDLGSGTWPANTEWMHGGATIINQPSVDAGNQLLYFTTGNAGPWSGRGPGDDLFTASMVAIDASTGAYRWHFQIVHHDIWDYDCPSNTVLFDTVIGGAMQTVVAEPCKTGWVYELDRRTGNPVTEIEEKPVPQSAFQNTAATQPIPAGDNFAQQCPNPRSFRARGADGEPFAFGCIFTPFDDRRFTAVAPGSPGGSNWNPAAYDPNTGYLYVCSRNSQYAYRALPAASDSYVVGASLVGAQLALPSSGITTGAFTAMNMSTNRIVWARRYARSAYGAKDLACGSGSLATAGGLVFMGLPEGLYHGIVAYDSSTGARLWRFRTDAGIESPPLTYSVEGKQYVAVYAGGRTTTAGAATKGDSLYVFSLDGTIASGG